MLECRTEIIFPPMLVVMAILKEDAYNKCPKDFGSWFLQVSIFVAILSLLYHNYQFLNDRGGADGIIGLSIIFYFIYNATGTYKYIYLLFHDHSCFNQGVFTIFGINFGLYLIIVSAILITICCEMNRSRQFQQRVDETKTEYFVLLEKILEDENFNVEDFINRNKDFIDSVEFLEEDKTLLKKYCMRKYSIRESSTNSDTCAICVGEFEIDEEVLEHPICRHTYHWECLHEWLVTKRSCPICREGTRLSLIRHLANLRDEMKEMKELKEFEKVDEKDIEGSKNLEKGDLENVNNEEIAENP